MSFVISGQSLANILPFYIFTENLLALGCLSWGAALMFSSWKEMTTNDAVFELKLLTSGPYDLVRHPFYTGLIGASFGLGILSDSVDRILYSSLLAIILVSEIRSFIDRALMLHAY